MSWRSNPAKHILRVIIPNGLFLPLPYIKRMKKIFFLLKMIFCGPSVNQGNLLLLKNNIFYIFQVMFVFMQLAALVNAGTMQLVEQPHSIQKREPQRQKEIDGQINKVDNSHKSEAECILYSTLFRNVYKHYVVYSGCLIYILFKARVSV